jgi:hypothetical protein
MGCILGELLLRAPLLDGDHAAHQLEMMNELLGSPPAAELWFVESARAKDFMLRTLPRCPGRDLARLLPRTLPAGRALLRDLLRFDPLLRPAAAAALGHPWLAGVRDTATPGREAIARGAVDAADVERLPPSRTAVKRAVFDEVNAFHAARAAQAAPHPPPRAGSGGGGGKPGQ